MANWNRGRPACIRGLPSPRNSEKEEYMVTYDVKDREPYQGGTLFCSERHTCKDTVCRGFTFNLEIGPTITSCPYSTPNFKKIKMLTFFEEKMRLAIEGK